MQASGLKVLVIEDRRENIVFLANNIFKPKGFEVITARDGHTGLRKALEEGPDLIIADLNIPKMSGLEIIADLRDRGAQIPFIVTALHGSETMAVQAFRAGVIDYLVKPLKADDVEAALHRVFSLSSDPQAGVKLVPVNQFEDKIAELEALIVRQSAQITANQEHEKEVESLTSQRDEQQQLTIEARNQAKALMQFMIAQQKEIDRQKKDAEQLLRQISIVSNKLHSFVQRIDNQAAQFRLIVPDSGSSDVP